MFLNLIFYFYIKRSTDRETHSYFFMFSAAAGSHQTMSVSQKLTSLSVGWESVLGKFSDTTATLRNFSPDRLITLSMTVTATTNSSAVPKQRVYDLLAKQQTSFALSAKVVKITPKMRKPRFIFLNSASLQYKGPYSGQKGVKVFENGRLHVTGSRSSAEARRAYNSVYLEIEV